MRAIFACFLSFLMMHQSFAAVRGEEVRYVGGTIAGWSADVEGRVTTDDPKVITFTAKGKTFVVPYDTVSSIEYGQKAGRRIGATIGWGVTTLGIAALPILLSKKRKHFVSLGFKDDQGQQQGVVLELPKGMTRSFIAILEARTGMKCEYESEEARKHVHG